MSYIKTEWDNGDIITAEKLNNVESGIEEINVSYEKTTWETGDTITAEKLNNIETGIEEAGSSDFSTAQVTFITNLPELYAQIYGAITDISSQLGYPTSLTSIATLDAEITNGDVYTVVLYNGNTYVTMQADNITVSGNATAEEYIPEDTVWLITITGDCTITAGSSSPGALE